MEKPYIFGHRGAMGYKIENTLESFELAVEMGAGIESDLHLTKDNSLVCFHDLSFEIDLKWYSIKNLTLNELLSIEFKDKREIPLLEEVFKRFNGKVKDLRYSFDIGSRTTALDLIKMAKNLDLLESIEITDTNANTLYYIRKRDKSVNLVHTIPYQIPKINQKTVNFDKLKDNNIFTLNLKSERATKENFKSIVDNGFTCYVWNVNGKGRMKKTLNLSYKDHLVEAMYTNFPDKLIELRNQYYS